MAQIMHQIHPICIRNPYICIPLVTEVTAIEVWIRLFSNVTFISFGYSRAYGMDWVYILGHIYERERDKKTVNLICLMFNSRFKCLLENKEKTLSINHYQDYF